MDESKIRTYAILILGIASAIALCIIGSTPTGNLVLGPEEQPSGSCLCEYDDGIITIGSTCTTWKDAGSNPPTFGSDTVTKLVAYSCKP